MFNSISNNIAGSSTVLFLKAVAYHKYRVEEEDNHIHQWFLTLGYSGVFKLQLPETPASMVGGEGFWELQSKTPE